MTTSRTYGIDDINYLVKAGAESHVFFNHVGYLQEPSNAAYLSASMDINFEVLDRRSRIVIGGKQIAEDDTTVRSGFYWNEFYWLTEFDGFDVTLGKAKQYWGIMETRNLVDVINTTDYLQGYNSTEKLAQNMFKVGIPSGSSQLDLYLLEGGEPRQFYEQATRFEPLEVADTPRYSAQTSHSDMDLAARYWYYDDNLEIAFTLFKGTTRTPLIIEEESRNVPYYYEIFQQGLELLFVDDRTLYKLEAVSVKGDGDDDDFVGASLGVEYAISRFFRKSDLTLVGEYHLDDKDERSAMVSFDDYVMLGGLMSFNDVYLSTFRVGVTFLRDDLDHYFYTLEGDIGLHEKVRLKVSGTFAGSETIPAYIENEDNPKAQPLEFIYLALEYAF